MAECPNSIEELEELEQLLPLCRKELFEQAKARVQAGVAKSLHDVSRQLGDETGRKPESIERTIRREQSQRGGTVSPLTQKYKSNNQFRTSFTGENEWYTPAQYIEAARQVMGVIDLDPATSDFGQSRIKAKSYYTIETNGLEKSWYGHVWLNPPYAQPLIAQFIEKGVSEYLAEQIEEMIILTHNYTDTAWFHNAEAACSLICFTRGRIKFEAQDGSIAAPTQGSAFFYFGQNGARFKEVFSQFGFIR